MNAATPARIAFSPRRVFAIVLRHWYLLSSSWPRVLDLIYWPAVQMLMWGFLQMYVSQHSGFFAQAAGTFIGAVLLWDILFRGQIGFSISFLEEMYARNMGNLMMSPLRPAEFIAALMIQSIIRLLIGLVPVSILAIAFFGFNMWGMGLALVAFFVNLILTSWAIGILVAGILLRHGLGAENMAWTFMFLFLPITCVYYPVSVLPGWLQVFAWMLPPTYVFEGMRALLIDHVFRADLMLEALALNAVLFGGAVAGFLVLLRSARREGTLLQGGD
jgi:ABC-2 type transport system permease protein